VATVADLGYSGALLDRPAIEELMDLAGRRAMDVVIATELARFSCAEPAGFSMYCCLGNEHPLVVFDATMDNQSP
jgi:hypothetical protein